MKIFDWTRKHGAGLAAVWVVACGAAMAPVAMAQPGADPLRGGFGAVELALSPAEASEDITKMSDALAKLPPQRPGIVDTYILSASLWNDPVFEREASVGEEVTHLVRQVCFVSMVALLAMGTPCEAADRALLALFAIDLVNSAVDVALEPRSRRSFGGLPPGEYLLHFLGTFGSGVAAAAYVSERGAAFAPAPAWQTAPLIASGVLLLAFEAALFFRAVHRRWPTVACCWSRPA